MTARKLIVGLLLVAAVAAGGFYWFGHARAGNGDHAIRLSGNIEVIEAQMAFKLPGRVEQRPVDEGEVVKQGQLIARLETADLQCDVAQLTAALQAAQAAVAALEAGSRPEEIRASEGAMNKAAALLEQLLAGSRPQEIAAAQATYEGAVADEARLEKESTRAAQLHEHNAMSPEDYDRARTAYEVALRKMQESSQRLSMAKEGPRKEEIEQARAALAQARSQYELIKAGPRREDIDQGRAKMRQAEAALALAQTRLGYAELHAPMPGVVLSKNIEPGEYVSPGTPVVTIGNLRDIWLRGYVNETDLDKVKLGQRAVVTTSTRPGRSYEGRVSFISEQAEFTPKTVQTEQERVKLVYRVKIDIDNSQQELKPGMPADAEISIP